jgi:hypothetical protein
VWIDIIDTPIDAATIDSNPAVFICPRVRKHCQAHISWDFAYSISWLFEIHRQLFSPLSCH